MDQTITVPGIGSTAQLGDVLLGFVANEAPYQDHREKKLHYRIPSLFPSFMEGMDVVEFLTIYYRYLGATYEDIICSKDLEFTVNVWGLTIQEFATMVIQGKAEEFFPFINTQASTLYDLIDINNLSHCLSHNCVNKKIYEWTLSSSDVLTSSTEQEA